MRVRSGWASRGARWSLALVSQEASQGDPLGHMGRRTCRGRLLQVQPPAATRVSPWPPADFPAPPFPNWLQPDLSAPASPLPTRLAFSPDRSQSWLHKPHLLVLFLLPGSPSCLLSAVMSHRVPLGHVPTPPPNCPRLAERLPPPESWEPLLTPCGPPQWRHGR